MRRKQTMSTEDQFPQKVEHVSSPPHNDVLTKWTKLPGTRLLTAEEEKSLASYARTGGEIAERARNLLVEANMRLVFKVARHYQSCQLPLDDLVQEGAIGLVTAAERYDPSLGFRFSTYATHWIRQAISRALENKTRSIRLPAHVTDSLRKMEKIRSLYIREHGEDPNDEQLAVAMSCTLRKIQDLLQVKGDAISLDTLIGESDGATIGSMIDDHSSPCPQEMTLTSELRGELGALFMVLTPREREVMQRRLGFGSYPVQVLNEIGECLHLSRERVRQIEVEALRKLRFAARKRDLRGYISG